MKVKKCFKCGKEKNLSEYYKHPQMGDGHLNKCKTCTKKDAIVGYNKKSKNEIWKENERTRGREKYRRLYVGTGKADAERNDRYKNKYPEKVLAKNACFKIKNPDGKEKHHWSYLEEHYTDVIFLTKKDHKKAHRFLVYDQERRLYRRFDDNSLLDDKTKHEAFILNCIKNKED